MNQCQLEGPGTNGVWWCRVHGYLCPMFWNTCSEPQPTPPLTAEQADTRRRWIEGR
jgi:hypothetical protein